MVSSQAEPVPPPPDMSGPFVPSGGDRPMGLSKREQIARPARRRRPLQLERAPVDADLNGALGRELGRLEQMLGERNASDASGTSRRDSA